MLCYYIIKLDIISTAILSGLWLGESHNNTWFELVISFFKYNVKKTSHHLLVFSSIPSGFHHMFNMLHFFISSWRFKYYIFVRKCNTLQRWLGWSNSNKSSLRMRSVQCIAIKIASRKTFLIIVRYMEKHPLKSSHRCSAFLTEIWL